MTRDLSRDAPGRTRKSNSNTNTTAIATRLLEEKIFTAHSLEVRGASFYRAERTFPFCLVKEVQDDVAQKRHPIANSGFFILVLRSLE